MDNYGAGAGAGATENMYNEQELGMGPSTSTFSAPSAAPYVAPAAAPYAAPPAAAPSYSSDASKNVCPPGTIPGDLWGCKPSNNCPDGSAKPWHGICPKSCNYDEEKTFYGSCKKKGSFFGGKKSGTKKQNRRMYGGSVAIPYSPNVWTEPGQYPSAVGGRRRKYSKTAQKHKKHRKTNTKHKKNKKHKKHSKITRKHRRK